MRQIAPRERQSNWLRAHRKEERGVGDRSPAINFHALLADVDPGRSATHDLDLVRRSNYRTIELNHGRIVFDSSESPAPARRFDEPLEIHDTPTGTESI